MASREEEDALINGDFSYDDGLMDWSGWEIVDNE